MSQSNANPQSRKYNLTVNNPQNVGLSLEDMDHTILDNLNPQYYARSMEISESGTTHFHAALFRPSPIRFSTLKRLLPTAHIEKAYGTMEENRDYIAKGGKWATTDKADTVVPGTFKEFGQMPAAQEEKATTMTTIMKELEQGKTTAEILALHPEQAMQAQKIDALREILRTDKVSGKDRGTLDVSYVYGATGTGKTRSVYDTHDARDICRITNYGGSNGVRFDQYQGQDVLVFDEFASQVPLSDMLNYLDRYPLMLPARYADRAACYTKVYIISNLPLTGQYKGEQANAPERWAAFCRRLTRVLEYQNGSVIIAHKGAIPNAKP